MADLPLRTSLHGQLLKLLREGVVTGRWGETLPPETHLCRDFGVSRTTLRKALAQLARDRLVILGGRGRLHQTRKPPREKAPPSGRVVRVLTPYPSAAHGSLNTALLRAVAERLEPAGYRMEIECHPGIFRRFRASALARLDALPDTAAWLLCYSTPAMQRWFADCGRPAVVLGRAAEDAPLSSVQIHYDAVGRHAAGLFHARGHRDLVYLIDKATSLGDRAVAQSFVAEARRLGARARVVSYEMEPSAIARCLDALLAARTRPTAFCVGASDTTLSVLCHLQAAGVKVPAEASLLAAWDDYTLDLTFPAVSRYRCNARQLGRLAADTLLSRIASGCGAAKVAAILPEFVAKGSLGPGPASRPDARAPDDESSRAPAALAKRRRLPDVHQKQFSPPLARNRAEGK